MPISSATNSGAARLGAAKHEAAERPLELDLGARRERRGTSASPRPSGATSAQSVTVDGERGVEAIE